MGDCKHNRQVSAYHDGELPEEERVRLEAHVARCASCARELEELRELSRALSGTHIPGAPAAVFERWHGTVATVRERVLIGMAEALTAAAAVVLAACASWVWYGSGKTEASVTMPNTWELAAVGVGDESTTSDTQQFVQWMVRDLSLENGHD